MIACSISAPLKSAVSAAKAEVELFRVEAALLQVDRKEGLPGFRVRQIDEEDLVEPALSQQFRRQTIDVVRRGSQEAARFPLLHPGEKSSEDPLRDAAVRLSEGRCEAFLDLVNPETQGRELIDRL